ncbi:sugar MFS transporter [Massilia sp. G4R7]|uniref:Sugar MFS transporter n=1 Tax=Massilia phyllostachyos TaxID=2898585 RepID=A0ABS8Q6H0_9BURK|nr:sugar MFS transporter [Massilia phyllostachyos]MCD2517350.1 sugar MFS transporter [Massilia phyllostachyos]
MKRFDAAPAAGSTREVIVAMLFVGMLFFILGFVTWLNGSLIPYLKIVCDLSNFQALFVTFAFYIAYTVMALPSAAVLNRVGYKHGMTIGLGVMAAGALLFIPAARSAAYPLFLLALFTLATGATLMQTAVNPYLVCIGSRESAAMRISIMGLFNKGAGIVVPIVFASLMLSGAGDVSDGAIASMGAAQEAALRVQLADRLVFPYLVMAGGLLLVMVIVHFSRLREIAPEQEADEVAVRRFGVLQFPQLVLGALALFAYVGVEVIAGDTIGLYGQHLNVKQFGVLTSYTMGFMAFGYLVGVVAIPRLLAQKTALMLSALLGILFTCGVLFGSGMDTGLSRVLLGWAGVPAVPDSVMYLALLGFANALVWPAIWPLALEGLGKYTAAGSALLVMGVAGGALLPMLYGHFSDAAHPQTAYAVMLPCYALILFYAVKGHALRRWGWTPAGSAQPGDSPAVRVPQATVDR